jgi:UDP-N-acetylglucosamine:LPS N-acetylglucosamine transferase
VEHQAGMLLEEKDCTPIKVKEIINHWLDRPEFVAEIGRNAKLLARPQAGYEAAKTILDYRRNN